MSPAAIRRLIGVYGADGGLRGELTYWVGARLGRAHCSLCDVTHGLVRPREEWKHYVAGLPVPFETFHRDDQPAEVRAAADDQSPCVVAETAGGLVLLLHPDDLEACSGSVSALGHAVTGAAEQAGLTLGG